MRSATRPAAHRGQLQGQLVVVGLAGHVADRPGAPGQHVGQLGGLARDRVRSRHPDIMCHGPGNGWQVRVLGPQAERAVRPDPVNYPHALLPSDDTSTQHANSGPLGRC